MKFFYAATLVLLACACQPQASQTPTKPVVAAQPLEQQLTDSLRKYLHLTEFRQNGDSARYVLYGRQINNQPVGVVAITDSVLLLSQKIAGKWRITDRISFPSYAERLEVEQLNNDDEEDFIVYSYPNMHGQQQPYVFMSDSAGHLHYRPEMSSLYNLSYNRGSKRLHAYYVGGAYSEHSKKIYCWQGDSLKLLAEAKLDMYSGTTTLLRYMGKKYSSRTYRNEAVYDTALFQND